MTRRILIVEDHRLVAVGLQLALRARGWSVEVTDGPTAAEVLELAAAFRPDCVLLDLRLGDELGSGLDLIEPLSEHVGSTIMLTAETDRYLLASCIEAGAAGWVGKDVFVDELVASVEDVLAGRLLLGCNARDALLDELRIHRGGLERPPSPLERLSRREENVLGGLVDGLSAEEIAASQFVALTTVRSQIRSILQKLGVRSQLGAVAMANRAGWKTRNAQRIAEQLGNPDRELQLT